MNLNAGDCKKDRGVRDPMKENKRYGRESIFDPVPKRG